MLAVFPHGRLTIGGAFQPVQRPEAAPPRARLSPSLVVTKANAPLGGVFLRTIREDGQGFDYELLRANSDSGPGTTS